MAQETERKFLPLYHWKERVKDIIGEEIRQGYLNEDPHRTIRVRIKGNKGFLTIKGKTEGISRQEFEYPIPQQDAEGLLLLCKGPLIEKRRFTFMEGPQQWEVDEFFGDNAGLVIAEAELEHDLQALELPEWIGEEVSHDPRYYNSQLSQKPFGSW
ncbi:CYTH domain-containing protein [Nafulsella turpanensis]|uniref:CYTH domain-containing protein n=1 Tax=Nafulsella turpanensis TaxID=1265690 RepID=UPI00034D69CD|nr:CYTH domain-containing protein [Nafulsella turpanensis]